MLWAALALFGLIVLLLAAALLRRTPAADSTRLWLLGGGIVLPGAMLTVLLAYALTTGERLLPHGKGQAIEVLARQWTWTFLYDLDGTRRASDNVLHLPAGRAMDMRVTSTDVIHGFWVPRLGGKIDAIPGRTTVVRLLATEPGRFLGLCAEFCGAGHAGMAMAVEAHPDDDFRRIVGSLRLATAAEVEAFASPRRGR